MVGGLLSILIYTQSSTSMVFMWFLSFILADTQFCALCLPLFFLAHGSPFPSHPPAPPCVCCAGGWREGGENSLWLGARPWDTPLLLFGTAGARQDHSSQFRCCWAPASSGVEHVPPFLRELSWCQPRQQLGVYQQWPHVFTLQHCSRFWEFAKHSCWKLSKL